MSKFHKSLIYIKDINILLFVSKGIRKFFYKKNSKLSWKINDINEQIVEKYLNKQILNSKYEFNEKEIYRNNSVSKDPIWVTWLQGEECAPDIVKCCIHSIQKNSNGHDVIIITEKNLNDYIKLPKFIYEKFEKGIISRTHLSDIIRLNLLTIYGGLWLDATVFVGGKIPKKIFDKDFYSINFGKKTKDPSHGRWTTFCMQAKKGNILLKNVMVDHYKYWYNHNVIVDYIMFDYLINIEIKNSTKLKKLINGVPINNTKVFELVDKLNSTSVFCYKNCNNTFYKLSYKRKLVEKVDGKKTNYGKILEEYL